MDEKRSHEQGADPRSESLETLSPPVEHVESKPAASRDSAWLAWSQVLMAHLVMLNAAGYTNAFGFFQAFYTEAFHESPSNISWVGSIQGFILLFAGAFVGRAVDAGYTYHLVAAGLALQLLGVFMTSLATQYWQLILAQGICQGIGGGLATTPAMVVVATYFTTGKRALAMCGASSGSATGGVIFPLVARQLLGYLGIAWTIRIMGFIMMANSALILLLVRPKPAHRKGGELLAFASFKDGWYSVFGTGMFLAMLGLYFTYYYVTSYARDVLGASITTGLELLLVINGLGLPGRFIPCFASDWYLGPQNTLVIITTLTAICVYAWAGIHTLGGVWALVSVYGIVAASIQSLIAPALASAGRSPSKIGAEMGMLYTVMSLGGLAGAPIDGALITAEGGKYLWAQMFAGSVIMAAAILFLVARVQSHGLQWKKC